MRPQVTHDQERWTGAYDLSSTSLFTLRSLPFLRVDTRTQCHGATTMTAEHMLLVIFGLVAGGALGYVTAWRFARKLEHHEVVLAEWDQPMDMQAPRPARVIGSIRQ